MSDARDGLMEAARGRELPKWSARNALDAFLSRPDDLLAVLVEAGVLERKSSAGWGQKQITYRRIEGSGT